MNAENQKAQKEMRNQMLKELMLKAINHGAEKFHTMDAQQQKKFRELIDSVIMDIGAKITDLQEDRQVAINAMLKIEGNSDGANT